MRHSLPLHAVRGLAGLAAAVLAVASLSSIAGAAAPRQDVEARLAPLGAGLLPATDFGAATVVVEAAAATPGAFELELVLVGAPRDGAVGVEAGAVNVFVRRPGGFDRERHLLPARGPNSPAVLSAREHFGAALAVSPASGRAGPGGATRSATPPCVAIGAPGRDVRSPAGGGGVVAAAGGVTLVERLAGGWRLRTELTAPSPSTGADFGRCVALGATRASSPTTPARRLVIVGAPGDSAGGAFLAGAAHVFVEGAGGWTALVSLAAPHATTAGRFGAAVALVVDAGVVPGGPAATCIAVAAPGDDGAGPGAGAVFLFDLQGRLLDERRAGPDVHLRQPSGARYGERLAALGQGRLAIAAPARGAVELVRVQGGRFVREALWTAHPSVGFGLGLAGGVDTLAIGAPFGGPGAPLLGAGRVTVLRRNGGVWCAAPEFGEGYAGAGQEPRAELGHALALSRSGATLVATAPGSDFACPGAAPCAAGLALVLATRPAARAFCASRRPPGDGALEALGSASAAERRLRLVAGGLAPGRLGVLHAAPGFTATAIGNAGCLLPPVLRIGVAAVDRAGQWQLDMGDALGRLAATGLGTRWAFQVAWRGGGHSSGVELELGL